MRILLGAGGLLKNCKFRVRWYSKEMPFLPPKDICERVRRAIEARARRITHLTRLRPNDAKEAETPVLEIICRAWASSSGSSSSSRGKSKEPKAVGLDDKQGKCLTNQSLSNKPPKIPLIPPENIKQEPQIQLGEANSDKLEIFSCKTCRADGSGEDLETSDMQNCKNYKANESVLKKELSASDEPSKQPTKPPVCDSPKEKPQQSGKLGDIKQGSKVQANPPAKAQDTPSVKGPQEKAKAASSQSEKTAQNLAETATMPSASPFPSGRNPCRDDKQGAGEKSQDAAPKRSSCAKENAKVEERKKDCSNKQEIKESEQKKPPTKPVKEMAQKCVSPKMDEEQQDNRDCLEKLKIKKSEEKNKSTKKKEPQVKENIVKPSVKGPQEKAKATSSQSEKPAQNAATMPSASPFPSGRNPCEAGKQGAGKKSQDAAPKRSSCVKENAKIEDKQEIRESEQKKLPKKPVKEIVEKCVSPKSDESKTKAPKEQKVKPACTPVKKDAPPEAESSGREKEDNRDCLEKLKIKKSEQKKPPTKPVKEIAQKCVSPKNDESKSKSEVKPSQEVVADPKEQKVKPASSQSEKPPQNAATMPSASPFPPGRNPCGDGKQGAGGKSQDAAPRRSSCAKEDAKVKEKKEDCFNKQEIKENEQKKPPTKPVKEIAQKCVSSKNDESKSKSEVKPSQEVVADPKKQKVKPASSQSEKPPQNAATMPSASPFPPGRNPCGDGKQGAGGKSQDAPPKRSSCAKEDAKVKERKEDCSNKQEIKESEQKKPPTKPVKEISQKCVSPKTVKSKTKSEVKPSQEVIADRKEQKVKPASTQSEKHPQNAATKPSASPFPPGRNPCGDGKQGAGEKSQDATPKRSSCAKEDAKVKERKEDCSNKQEIKDSEQKKLPSKPVNEISQKCVSPKTVKSKTKSEVKPSQEVIADRKEQKVKPASTQSEKHPQNAATKPSASPFPPGRNPCGDGKQGAGEKSQDAAPKRSSCAKEDAKVKERMEDCSNKQEIKKNEQKKTPTKPVKEIAQKCVSPKTVESKTKSEREPSQEVVVDPKEQKVKPASSQSEKTLLNRTDAASMPSESPFPSGRSPCRDGKQGAGGKSQDAAPKQSSCAKEDGNVKKRKEDCSNKQEIEKREQKKPPMIPPVKEIGQKCVRPKIDESKTKAPKEQKVKPPCTPVKKDTPPNAESSAREKEDNRDCLEKLKIMAKSQVHPSQDVVADPKEQKVKNDDPPKAAPQSQTASEWKQPPLPTSNFSFPLLSAFPAGRNPCRDGPRGASENQLKEEGELDMKPEKEECIETRPRNAKASDATKKPKAKANGNSDSGWTQKTTKEIKPSTEHPKDSAGLKPAESVPTESVKEAVKASEKVMSEAQKASAAVTNKDELKEVPKKVITEAQKPSESIASEKQLKEEGELDMESEEKECIETRPRKYENMISCLNAKASDATKNPQVKANGNSDSGRTPKTTKEIKPSTEHPKDSADLKPSESVPTESVKEAVKASEKVMSEAQKASAAAEKLSESIASENQLKEEGELDMESEEKEFIETRPRKYENMISCFNAKASDATKNPQVKANGNSDSGRTPKTTKEIKPSTEHPKDSAGLKPSESVPTESVKEAVKAFEKVMSEAQKASAAVTNKDELKEVPKKVITEAQKPSESIASENQLKEEGELDMESEEKECIETRPRKYENMISCLNAKASDATKNPKVKANGNSNSGRTPKTTKQIKPSTEHPKDSAGLKPSESASTSLELKKFPAAPLKRTLTAYLDSIEPLLTAEEFKKEVKLTEEFEENEGQKLQKLLESEAEGSSNWLTPRWTRAAYLANQAPVTTFTSPALSFPVQNFKDPIDCLFFTARAIRAMYEFKKLVDEDKIPVAKMGDNVLDNSQFVNIFGTVRRPVRFCDVIEQYSDSDYVVVVYRNNYFKLPILSSSGNLLSATCLVDELVAIIESPLKKGEPYGLLTHDKRDNWVEAYRAMYCLPGNADSLEAIERSLFLVCLDKAVHIPNGQEYIVQAHQLLYGGGVENSANRWMDKTIQLIVNPNGLAGFCYEHSPAECQPLAMLMEYVVEKVESESKSECESKQSYNGNSSNQAKHLRFQPRDECINMWLHVAMRNIMKIAIGLRMNVFEYECHGTEFIKAQGLNSDSYIQMALQLAYYNMHKTLPAQYESAHLRMFVDGRTETIRSTSNESKAFVLAMNSESASPIEKMKALQKAVDFHEKLTKRALSGEGIDRHLFGLQQMALENCLPMPEFFRSKGFVQSVTFQLSTSQVATSSNSFMVYGPPTCNGYGCCYNPQDCKLTFAISAWQTTMINPEAYGKAIIKSLDAMRRLILQTGGDRVGENPCRCKLIQI